MIDCVYAVTILLQDIEGKNCEYDYASAHGISSIETTFATLKLPLKGQLDAEILFNIFQAIHVKFWFGNAKHQ